MAGKSKFQIARSLDERLKSYLCCNEDTEPEFASLDGAFILGFNYANVTNYHGLTTHYRRHNSTCPAVGRAYFRSMPSEQQIKADLDPVREYFNSSPECIGSHAKVDKNEHLYLIYYKDEETQSVLQRLFDVNTGLFMENQPSLTILDDTKIYSHSAMVKLNVCFKLELFDQDRYIHGEAKLNSIISDAKESLCQGKGLKLHLKKSNFSSSNPLNDNVALESLYSHLDVPDEVQQMGDYLPQMSKEDKKKVATKWRNKVKDQRFPLEMVLEHDDLSMNPEDEAPEKFYKLELEDYLYLQVNDSVAKSTKLILMLLMNKLESIKTLPCDYSVKTLSPGEIASCTFRPDGVNHFVPAVYLLPKETKPRYDELAKARARLHLAYMIPMNRPAVRYSQRICDINLKNPDQQQGYLCNVHSEIRDKSGIKGGTKTIIGGTYTYHHYLQNRIQDSGWGCAYRSLQTIISWYKHQGYIYSPDVELRAPRSKADDKTSSLRAKLSSEARVPTHDEIQSVLVDVGDKQPSFIGSQKWIGSQEVCYVLSHLYNLDSKFISVSSGAELVYKARDLGQHFSGQSTPVMIGGGVLAHTIIGLDFNEKNGDISYLILDPHYTGGEDLATIMKKGWCGWKKNAFWDKNSFYNLCLPQRPPEY